MTNFSLRRFRGSLRQQAGLSLIEVLASLTIAALVVGGALSVYNNANTAQNTRAVAEAMISISTSVRALYTAAGGSYGAANTSLNEAVRNAGRLPTTLGGTGSTITHPLGGNITIAAQVSEFDIKLGAIPRAACVDLVTRTYPNAKTVAINAVGATTTGTATDLPIAAGTAATSCLAAGSDVTFRFN